MRRALLALLLLLLGTAAAAGPATAQSVSVSPAPEALSVTVYRAPERRVGEEMELEWLQGFALISETRTVALPAGESVIRFEGVAGGIIPASAIVAGLPDGVNEKNRDARLISPGTLVDAALGRRVHIRRTDRATGRVTESEAIIRAGPNGVVMQTPEGVEALRCSGLAETLLFPEVPAGLSAKPTLAVTTRAPAATTVTVRLSYLATDFDWQANYIANVAPDGKTLDLFAWLTLANGNDESFADARTQAVAGTLSKNEDDEDSEPAPVSSQILANCWPLGSTSDIPLIRPPQPPLEFGESYAPEEGDIVVTGSRIRGEKLLSVTPVTVMSAEQEELGDLKLYRIPEPVTVAAHAQKQVALLSRTRVPFERFYGITVGVGYESDEPEPAFIILRTRNVAERRLGLPLPAGRVAVFEPVDGRELLVGETVLNDAAVGQEVELTIGDSPGVRFVQRRVRGREDSDEDDDDEKPRRYELEISNDHPDPVDVEVTFRIYGDYELTRPSRKLKVKDGRHFWPARVPANGRAVLTYTRNPEPPPKRDEDEEEDEDD